MSTSEQSDHAATFRLGSPALGPPLLALEYRQVGALDRRADQRAWQTDLSHRLDRIERTQAQILGRLLRPPWWQRWWAVVMQLWRS